MMFELTTIYHKDGWVGFAGFRPKCSRCARVY